MNILKQSLSCPVVGMCRAAVIRNYLPLAFLVANVLALAWPLPGIKVLEPKVQKKTSTHRGKSRQQPEQRSVTSGLDRGSLWNAMGSHPGAMLAHRPEITN